MDDILSRVTDGTIVQCTFDNREKIVSLLKDLKENRPGISVIISGSRILSSSVWRKQAWAEFTLLNILWEHGKNR